jgi:hypothetical protein
MACLKGRFIPDRGRLHSAKPRHGVGNNPDPLAAVWSNVSHDA